jgi:hypothetical protein
MTMPGFTADKVFVSDRVPAVYQSSPAKVFSQSRGVVQVLDLDIVRYLECIARGGGTECLHRVLGGLGGLGKS